MFAVSISSSGPTPLASASEIAFWAGDYSDIFVIHDDGSGRRRLTSGRATDRVPAWSADGKWIAFERDGDIFKMRSDGSSLRRLTSRSNYESDPAWAPSRRKIDFTMDRNGNTDLYVMRANGTRRLRLTRNGAVDTDPVWHGDRSRAREDPLGLQEISKFSRVPLPRNSVAVI